MNARRSRRSRRRRGSGSAASWSSVRLPAWRYRDQLVDASAFWILLCRSLGRAKAANRPAAPWWVPAGRLGPSAMPATTASADQRLFIALLLVAGSGARPAGPAGALRESSAGCAAPPRGRAPRQQQRAAVGGASQAWTGRRPRWPAPDPRQPAGPSPASVAARRAALRRSSRRAGGYAPTGSGRSVQTRRGCTILRLTAVNDRVVRHIGVPESLPKPTPGGTRECSRGSRP